MVAFLSRQGDETRRNAERVNDHNQGYKRLQTELKEIIVHVRVYSTAEIHAAVY